jgi:membrane protease YdiL (CAAX protease family)
LVWTLLPCVAIWAGLYHLKSAVWAYALYHGVCLIPAIIWGRTLWRATLVAPSLRDCALLIGASILFAAGAVIGYELLGSTLLSNENVPVLLKEQGIVPGPYLLLGCYSITVNPLLEEIFWRGVVLNELDRCQSRFKHFGITWSSLAYALFHYFIFRLVLYPGWAEVGTVLLAAYGAMLALIYRKSGSILTTALAHGLLTDLACVSLVVYYFHKFGMAL